MGSYLSVLQWSDGPVQAPELSKVEVEIDEAKHKIDSELNEIVQEITSEGLTFHSSTVETSEDVDVSFEEDVNQSETSSSPSKRAVSFRKEKKWYHKFTGNVQRTEEVSLSILADRRIQAVEKRAAEMKADLDKQLEQVETRNKIRLLALQQKIHPDFRGKKWRFDEKRNFNFAVVGCSGVGKSTFINSLLGLMPHQPGAAHVSAGVEGTLVMQPYCLPGFPFIRIWDIPGGSGIDRPADSYFDMHCIDLFDEVLYLHEGRHHALQAIVILGCAATKTPVCIVVTKMDLLVESQLENEGKIETEENVVEAIQLISDSVTKECTAHNERFCKTDAGSALMLSDLRPSTAGSSLQTDEESVSRVCNVPFFFVSKRFNCRFGSFDAKEVISSMKAAARARFPSHPCSPIKSATTKSSDQQCPKAVDSLQSPPPSPQELPHGTSIPHNSSKSIIKVTSSEESTATIENNRLEVQTSTATVVEVYSLTIA